MQSSIGGQNVFKKMNMKEKFSKQTKSERLHYQQTWATKKILRKFSDRRDTGDRLDLHREIKNLVKRRIKPIIQHFFFF